MSGQNSSNMENDNSDSGDEPVYQIHAVDSLILTRRNFRRARDGGSPRKRRHSLDEDNFPYWRRDLCQLWKKVFNTIMKPASYAVMGAAVLSIFTHTYVWEYFAEQILDAYEEFAYRFLY